MVTDGRLFSFNPEKKFSIRNQIKLKYQTKTKVADPLFLRQSFPLSFQFTIFAYFF